VTVTLVLVGGALGAVLRYLTDLFVQSRHDSVFPWATLVVNTVGSLIVGGTAGAVTAAGGPEWVLTLVGVGFCGALTTFSTFGYETVRLLEEGSVLAAGLNVTASVTISMTGCVGGWALMAGFA
jgi:CrcB protein